MQRCLIIAILLVSGFLGFYVSINFRDHQPNNGGIADNTPPFVESNRTYHYPVSIAKQLENNPKAGEIIFKEFCSSCHAQKPTIDIKAPRMGNPQDWVGPRKLGMDGLLQVTKSGIAAMPARGGCFECSDEQLSQAIRYMLQNSQ